MSGPLPRVVALLAAYNEEDVIGCSIAALLTEGIEVLLLDDGSSDATRAEAERFLGRGLIGIVSHPPGAHFSLRRILEWKELQARSIEADWFLSADADEFRESPWEALDLRQAFARVERLGYNAVDFQVLEFQPTGERFERGDDPRATFLWYRAPGPYDRLQVRAWRRGADPVALLASGGHEASFPGRRVFPLRFLLRHYPVRGQAHGERKVLAERLARYDPAETALGWHRQYAGLGAAPRFERARAGLQRFDPEAARLELLLDRRGEAALELLARLETDLAAARAERDRYLATAEQHRHSALDRAAVARREHQRAERISRELHRVQLELRELHARLDAVNLALLARAARP